MSRKQPKHARATTAPRAERAATWAWLAPIAGVGWAAWNLRGGYFFYDDWAMIDRVLHTTPVEGITTGYNGHLWMLQDVVYRIQVFWFGVDDNTFIRGVFLCSLLLLHLSLAALLRASGLSRVSSLMLGGLLTYLGAAAENFMWPVQLSATLSVAAGVAAAAIALRHSGDLRTSARASVPVSARVPGLAAGPEPAHVVAVCVLTLLSVGLDSAIALMSVTLAAAVTLLAWRGSGRRGKSGAIGDIGSTGRSGRLACLAVVPAMLALGLWLLFADRGPSFPADAQTRAAFFVRLVLHAAGGVFGLGQMAGAIVLILSIALIAIGLRKRYLDRRPRIMLAAGTAAALVVAAALTVARAGIVGLDFTVGSRYLHNVVIPLTLAAAPGLAVTCRRLAAVPAGIGHVLIAAAFLLGLTPKQAWEPTFHRYNRETRDGIRSAAVVIRQGCPSGAPPDAASIPLDFIGPQVSTRLIRELLDRRLLEAPPPARLDPAIVTRMCGSGGTRGGRGDRSGIGAIQDLGR